MSWKYIVKVVYHTNLQNLNCSLSKIKSAKSLISRSVMSNMCIILGYNINVFIYTMEDLMNVRSKK